MCNLAKGLQGYTYHVQHFTTQSLHAWPMTILRNGQFANGKTYVNKFQISEYQGILIYNYSVKQLFWLHVTRLTTFLVYPPSGTQQSTSLYVFK